MPLTTLPSGLTVVSDPMAHVDTVGVGVWVETGTRSEDDGEHGIAHFLEHMAFKGTARRSAREISEAIETVGGEINAATSVETTAYHARMLAEDLPLALDILADILTEPRFDAADVERERNVILQEIGAAEDVPEDRAFDALPEAAFRGQPVGRRILGTRESVATVTAATLKDFFARHYTAGAMTVAAAGAVDHDRLVAAVERAFAAVPVRPAPAPPTARYTGGVSTEDADSAECQWILGFEGHAATHPRATAAHVAATVMGGGLSFRLFQALREERGLVYDTSAFHWAFADLGLFAIHLATAADDVEEATSVVLDELDAAIRHVSDEELARAKAQIRAGLLMSRESVSSRMGQAARHAIVWGRQLSKEERIAEIEGVTAADVRSLLADMTASAPTLVAIGVTEAPSPDEIVTRFAPLRGGCVSALYRTQFVRGTAALNEGTVLRGSTTRLKMPLSVDYAEWSRLRAESRHFLRPWEPTWPRDDLTRMAYRRRIRRYHREIRADEGYAFFVFASGTGELVGGLTLAHVKRGVTQSCTLGYWTGERFAGQGYMGDAVRTVIPWCFNVLGLHRIEAATLPHNERSMRLLKRAGFAEEGYARRFLCIDGAWRDHVLFGLVNGETPDPFPFAREEGA